MKFSTVVKDLKLFSMLIYIPCQFSHEISSDCLYCVRIPNEEAQLKEARWLFIITKTSGLFKAH